MRLKRIHGQLTIRSMSDYLQLLDAAIQHFQEMKSRGLLFVSISSEGMVALNQITARGPRKKAVVPPTTSKPLSSFGPIHVKEKASTEAVLPVSAIGSMEPSPVPKLSTEAKIAAFADLRQRALACVKCQHLASSRKNVVFGVGDMNAELMFVGEAPGADEDIQGEPFVGRAGQLLTRIIETMGLKRDSVYIANILKCRPDTPGQPTGNRKPSAEEMQTCIPFLHEQ